MMTHLITLVLGFAAGCTFKELIGKSSSKSSRNTPSHISSPAAQSYHNDVEGGSKINTEEFGLRSLKETFDLYNVKLLNAGSFGILLRHIRSTCYKDILKMFLDKANTPEILIDMLKLQMTPAYNFEVSNSVGSPYISVDKLNDYISKEGISVSEFKSNVEKVKFLLSLYYAKGIDDFKQTLGSYMSDILSAHEQGEDISEIYIKIMDLVKSRYNYLS